MSAPMRADPKVCPYLSENHSWAVFTATPGGDGFQPTATRSLVLGNSYSSQSTRSSYTTLIH